MGGSTNDGAYSGRMAFVFVFNLVVGFGALTLPHAFYSAGVLLSSLFMIVLASASYMTLTFLLEAMSIANFLEYHRREIELGGSRGKELHKRRRHGVSSPQKRGKDTKETTLSDPEPVEDEESLVIDKLEPVSGSPFELRRKFELSDMGEVFLSERWKKVLFNVTLLYLFGDLAIYACAVPTTLAAFSDGFQFPLMGGYEARISRGESYSIWLSLFALIVVPLSAFNFQKTRTLQLVTCTYRNLALVIMIGIATSYLLFPIPEDRSVLENGKSDGLDGEPMASEDGDGVPIFRPKELPLLYGVATYAFMCHHSLPSIVSPVNIEDRRKIGKILFLDYCCILFAYLLLCLTAVAAFGGLHNRSCTSKPGSPPCQIQNIYILNFEVSQMEWVAKFLVLLPVFVGFTSYPLIAITTRNNLGDAFSKLKAIACDWRSKSTTPITDETVASNLTAFHVTMNSLLVAVPPIIIAYFVHDVEFIVTFTGGYAGLAIEFVFPAMLVSRARERLEKFNKEKLRNKANPYQSPFRSPNWITSVYIWACTALVFLSWHMLAPIIHRTFEVGTASVLSEDPLDSHILLPVIAPNGQGGENETRILV